MRLGLCIWEINSLRATRFERFTDGVCYVQTPENGLSQLLFLYILEIFSTDLMDIDVTSFELQLIYSAGDIST